MKILTRKCSKRPTEDPKEDLREGWIEKKCGGWRKKEISCEKIFNFESVVVATLRLIPFSYVASRSIATASCSKTNEKEWDSKWGERKWRGEVDEKDEELACSSKLRNGAVCMDIFSVLFVGHSCENRNRLWTFVTGCVVRRYATISCFDLKLYCEKFSHFAPNEFVWISKNYSIFANL